MHGIIAASGDYLVLGKKSALAYLLADNNYDVWMGNSRGNKYASVNYRTADFSRLWDFSYNEIGQYDLAAMIDYVLAYTRQSKLFFVGHSQGTTALIVLLATRPEYNLKIAQAHLLAAVTFQKYLPNQLIRAIARPLNDAVDKSGLKVFDFKKILIFGNPISKILCNETLNYQTTQLCKGIIYAIVGVNKYMEEIDSVRFF
jgi:pimeloyl-ACP methyl ester carboxylesterase